MTYKKTCYHKKYRIMSKNLFKGKRNICVMKMKYWIFFSLYVNRFDFQRRLTEINKISMAIITVPYQRPNMR